MTDSANLIDDFLNSPVRKRLVEENNKWREACLVKWDNLDQSDKLDYLQAICSIMVQSETKGTSHRGLMNDLGVYPDAFLVGELMTIHNSLWSSLNAN